MGVDFVPARNEPAGPAAPEGEEEGAPLENGSSGEPLVEIVSSQAADMGQSAEQSPATPRQVVFTVQHSADRHMAYRVSGARIEQGICSGGWSVDFGSLNLQLRDMGRFLAASHQNQDEAGREAWRRAARELGSHMADGLLAVDRGLASAWKRSLRWLSPPERLTLVFAGPASYLSVPYELLVDSTTGAALALRYPLCRQVSGVPMGDGRTWRNWVIDLQRRGETLRVLLISSGAEHLGATDELGAVEAVFEDAATRNGWRVAVDLLLAGDAEPEQVRARLDGCPYHVVHYAGQIYHDEQHTEQSGLLFAARQDSQLGQVVVTGAELETLLTGGAARLVYLSAGIERAEPDAPLLRTRDDFDMLRALVNAGVPYAVGLRWYAAPLMRQHIAVQFYAHLLAEPYIPELALLRARQQVAETAPADESWMAPVLVAQNVYPGGD